jgi:hypothetical protein
MADPTDDPPKPDKPDKPDGESGFAAKMIGDLARRALTSGIGAMFMSEEALRTSFGDMKLPKEAMGYLVAQADKTKRDIIDVVGRETGAFLSKLEIEKVVAKMLANTTFEIETRIRIIPRDGGGLGAEVEKSPQIRAVPNNPERTSARRRKKDTSK